MSGESILLARPRWAEAAQALVDGCTDLADPETRVVLLERVCAGLGDALYPSFLRLLAVVGRHGDFAARAAVADALVRALQTGRLPAGRAGAWGRGAAEPVAAGWSRGRALGPVEFICVWHAQRAHGPSLPRLEGTDFDRVTAAVLDLFDAAPQARALYGGMLLAAADDPIEGALARSTRAALRALATAWMHGESSAGAAGRFRAALDEGGSGTLGAMARATLAR